MQSSSGHSFKLRFHEKCVQHVRFVNERWLCFQVVEDGYEFFSKRQLVTLFSAPNYCGEFDNAGAMMSVDDSLMCSFQILKVSKCSVSLIRRMTVTPRIYSKLSIIREKNFYPEDGIRNFLIRRARRNK